MERINRRYSGRVNRPICLNEKMVFDVDKKPCKIVNSYPVREDGSVIELDVDQFSGQPFMRNPNGFITNDIMMFEECQSDSVARAILNRLKVLHPDSINQNLSIDQMMAMSVPANYGSPAEFVSSQKMMASKMYKMYQDDVKVAQAAMAQQAAQKVQSEVSDLERSVPKSE